MLRLILTAFLYASLSLGANAEGLDELRAGDMRKLQLHDSPREMPALGFETRDGAQHALSDSAGKVRVVNFWATWCAPCRQEKPSLDRLQADMGGADFEVIAIATGRNTEASIEKFNAEVGIEHLTTYLDPGSQTARGVGVLGLPVSILIDREGREIGRLTGGADWGSDSARAILRALIAR